MTVLASATFAPSDVHGITVSVTRHCRMPDAQATWAVTVQDLTNVIQLRKFTSLTAALGFASEHLSVENA